MLSSLPSPDSETSLKKQKVNEELKTMDVEDEESDDDDWDLSKFGRLDPLTVSLPEPCKGIKTFTRDDEFDLEKELFTPDSPGDIVGDKACWLSYFKQINESEESWDPFQRYKARVFLNGKLNGNGSVVQEDQVSSEESPGVADNTSKKKSRKVSSKNHDQRNVDASEVPSTRQTKKRVAKGHTKNTRVDITAK